MSRDNIVSEEQDMIDILVELSQKEPRDFTSWELRFIDDMKEKIDENVSLTDVQLTKLQEIYEKKA